MHLYWAYGNYAGIILGILIAGAILELLFWNNLGTIEYKINENYEGIN